MANSYEKVNGIIIDLITGNEIVTFRDKYFDDIMAYLDTINRDTYTRLDITAAILFGYKLHELKGGEKNEKTKKV